MNRERNEKIYFLKIRKAFALFTFLVFLGTLSACHTIIIADNSEVYLNVPEPLDNE